MTYSPAPATHPFRDPHTGNRHRFGYWATAAIYLSLQAFTTVPSPLYARYAERDHLSPLVITLVYAAYAVGVTVSLICAGHLSDTFGRRPVLAAALAVDALSAVTFIARPGLPGLFAARVLCGLSVGVTASTATAYLGELFAGHRLAGQARNLALLSTAVAIGGLGAGPLLTGLVAEVAGHSLVSPYLVMLVIFVAGFAALLFAPETRDRMVPRPAYHVQRVSVPHQHRRRYGAALAGVATVFALFGLFVGLAGTILGQRLGHISILLTGVLLFIVYATGVASVAITIRLAQRRQTTAAGVLMIAGLALLALSVWLTSAPTAAFVVMFLCAGSLIGAGGSTLFTVSLAVVTGLSPKERTAETLAGFFLAGYVALSAPVIGVGVALQHFSLRSTLSCFAVLVGITACYALAGLGRES
ncbi:MFS transporter [Flexivirga caeni]|nr:MFS transporter [Flexivirga caeni]